ncbi:hypothetical protein CPSG_04445 [Coccidioides posadasii str. Silveira]|uniref:Uncharacterized protein n=1 Tax=Coccidioides posadasii (strain RMSCC 757 / Silveira) TaxID=443226 RepID=E9D4A6_COCPS|nr:hypothetical protein CPSG_04445 [Coccidioides posadasii str. Silveira]
MHMSPLSKLKAYDSGQCSILIKQNNKTAVGDRERILDSRDSKMFLEKFRSPVYTSLSTLMQDLNARPDSILSGYLGAVIDMNAECNVPTA